MTRYSCELEPADWVLIGYLVGLAVWWLSDALRDTDGRAWTEQSVQLDEDHLERMERGESIQIHRWHGHRLQLEGELAVDADELED